MFISVAIKYKTATLVWILDLKSRVTSLKEVSHMKYLELTCTKNYCCLSEIQVQWGIMYFHLIK